MLVSINIQDVQDMSPHCPRHISDTSWMYQLSRGHFLGLIMMSATCPDCPHIVEDVSQTHPRQSCLRPTLCQDVLQLSQWRLVQGKICPRRVPDMSQTSPRPLHLHICLVKPPRTLSAPKKSWGCGCPSCVLAKSRSLTRLCETGFRWIAFRWISLKCSMLWPVKIFRSKKSKNYFLLGIVNDIPKVTVNL